MSVVALFAVASSVMAGSSHWKGVAPNAASGTVYLYNIGTGKWLGRGGFWGTEAVQSDVALPLQVEAADAAYKLRSFLGAEGNISQQGYIGITEVVITKKDDGYEYKGHDWYSYYADRPDSDGDVLKFTFTQVDNGDGKYKYRISRALTNSGAIEVGEYGDTLRGVLTAGAYYMAAKYNELSSDKYRDDHSNCINGFISEQTDSTDLWIVVPESEYKSYFKHASASASEPAPATFLMKNNDFGRNDMSVTSWKRADGASLQLGDNLAESNDGVKEANMKHAPADAISGQITYTYTYTGSHSPYNGLSKHTLTYKVTTTTPPSEQPEALTISCDAQGVTGNIENEFLHKVTKVEVTLESYTENGSSVYTYYVGNGYAQSGDIHRKVGGKGTANIHGSSGKVYQSLDNLFREGWYQIKVNAWTTCQNEGSAKVYAKVGNATEATSSLSEYSEARIQLLAEQAPTTYYDASDVVNKKVERDGKMAYLYEAVVSVYLPAASGGKFANIEFGVEVANGCDDGWTCFDNIQIYYLGEAKKVVILDEDRTNVDYMTRQNTAMAKEQKATVVLHRELNAGKWNSLVLPFDMDQATINSVFGSGTVVSAFKGATEADYHTRMFFVETANIQKDGLYIIKPTEAPEVLKQRETAQDKGLASGDDLSDIYLEQGTLAYTIPSVVFGCTEEFPVDGLVYGSKGKETFEGAVDGVQMVGTLVSDQYSQDKTGSKLIPANSYVLAGNTAENHTAGMWYYRTVETKTKGFRGWLQVDMDKAKDVTFVFNGVEDSESATTVIEQLTGGQPKVSGRAGIYNLHGQRVGNGSSVDGLPRGVYIVNGRKCVVK